MQTVHRKTTWIIGSVVIAALAIQLIGREADAADPSVAEELRLMKEETVSIAARHRYKEHPLGDTIGSRVMGWLTIKW